MPSLQMLGLALNTFINAFCKEEYDSHMAKASMMDINDAMEPKTNFPPIVEEPMLGLKTNDNDDDDKLFSLL